MANILPYKYRAVISEDKPCSLCEGIKKDNMLKCKKCKLLFHSECLKVHKLTRSVTDWKCPNCEEEFKIISNYGKLIEENKKLKETNDVLGQNQVDLTKLNDMQQKN
jgi:hypothetical protein